MKRTLLLVGLMAGTMAFGQEEGRRRGGPPGGFMRMNPVLTALDADKDGTVSASELSNAGAALKALDKDNDAKLSAEELRPQFGGRGGPGGGPQEMVTRLMEFDKNSDGVLTKEELPERMQGLMERGDADKDGKLTKDELTKSAGSMRGGGPGGPGGRMDKVVAALDADQDGTISANEMATAATSLAKLDANSDGKLTEDEVRPNFGPGGGGRRKQ